MPVGGDEAPVTGDHLRLSYVVPLRRWAEQPVDELAGYLGSLAGQSDVVVVDGSVDAVFAAHAKAFLPLIRHLRVDRDLHRGYGKVNGVITGVRAARHERVVVADDDVRYDDASLRRMARLLDQADLVRTQNYFAELGRRRGGGAQVFPATCSLLAPVWVAERAVCVWLAVWSRLVRGGVPYAGTVLTRSASSLRRRRADGVGAKHT